LYAFPSVHLLDVFLAYDYRAEQVRRGDDFPGELGSWLDRDRLDRRLYLFLCSRYKTTAVAATHRAQFRTVLLSQSYFERLCGPLLQLLRPRRRLSDSSFPYLFPLYSSPF